ncbi:MAG: (2Fe-2S)-binding protein [Candidatus Limnocylindrales bacterium]
MAFRIDGDGRPVPAPTGAAGGFRYGSVLDPAVQGTALEMVAEQVDHQPRVVATASVLALGWASRVWVGALLLDRRVPLATLADATTELTAESIDGSVVLPHARFACLPSDPAAAHPDAHVVTDMEALRRTFHRVVTEALLAPVIEILVSRGAVGRKVLSGMIGSRFASTAEAIARGPAERRAMSAETLILAGGHPCSRGAPPLFFEERRGGGFALEHVRGACCLFYELPGVEKCGEHCPITPEGLARMRAARATA